MARPSEYNFMGDVLPPWLKMGSTRPNVNAPEIQPEELMNSGVVIQRGDPRLQKGIDLNNLTDPEREKVIKYRQGQGSGS